MRKVQGFTLIELMVVLAVMGVVLSMAVPSVSSFMEKRRIINAAEAVFSELQYARSEAISRSRNVYVKFSSNGTSTWVYGTSIRSDCDLAQTTATGANACILVIDDGDGTVDDGTGGTDTGDLVLRRTSSAAFSGISMHGYDSGTNTVTTTVSFGIPTPTSQTSFNPVRGTAKGGTVVLRLGTLYELRVIVSPVGRVRFCSPTGTTNVPGYPTC